MSTKFKMQSSHPLTGLRSLRIISTPKGEPESVIISIDEFESLLESVDIQARKVLFESIDRAREELRNASSLLTYEEVFGEQL